MTFAGFYDRYILGVGEKGEPEPPVRMPFAGVFFRPWLMLFENFGSFLKTAAVFAVLAGLLSWGSGYAYVCSYVSVEKINFYCREGGSLYLAYFFVRLLLLVYFGMLFCNRLKKTPLPLATILKSWRQALKNTLLLLLFMFTALVPILSFMILLARVPNPDWRVETAFFAVVSVGFFVPFFSIRFLSVLGRGFFDGLALPVWKIWQRSRGNLLKILFSLTFILMMSMFVFNNIRGGMLLLPPENVASWGGVIDLFYNFFVAAFFTLFLNHCLVQYDYLYNGETNEQ